MQIISLPKYNNPHPYSCNNDPNRKTRKNKGIRNIFDITFYKVKDAYNPNDNIIIYFDI